MGFLGISNRSQMEVQARTASAASSEANPARTNSFLGCTEVMNGTGLVSKLSSAKKELAYVYTPMYYSKVSNLKLKFSILHTAVMSIPSCRLDMILHTPASRYFHLIPLV